MSFDSFVDWNTPPSSSKSKILTKTSKPKGPGPSESPVKVVPVSRSSNQSSDKKQGSAYINIGTKPDSTRGTGASKSTVTKPVSSTTQSQDTAPKSTPRNVPSDPKPVSSSNPGHNNASKATPQSVPPYPKPVSSTKQGKVNIPKSSGPGIDISRVTTSNPGQVGKDITSKPSAPGVNTTKTEDQRTRGVSKSKNTQDHPEKVHTGSKTSSVGPEVKLIPSSDNGGTGNKRIKHGKDLKVIGSSTPTPTPTPTRMKVTDISKVKVTPVVGR
jgi:hypothetical protein